jgi:hypothetical protein
MSNNLPAAELSWKRSRYGFAGFWFVSLLVAWCLLRLVLLVAFRPAGVPGTDILLALLSGFHRDIFMRLGRDDSTAGLDVDHTGSALRFLVKPAVVYWRQLRLLVRADFPAVRRVLLL